MTRTPLEFIVGPPRYGGYNILQGDVPHPADLFVRFVLQGEQIEASSVGNGDESRLLRVLDASSKRVTPRCPHFGLCGGCDYQHIDYEEQLSLKRTILKDLLRQAGVKTVPEITTHASEPYTYRNRIRLRVEQADGTFRLGYNERGSTKFLPIVECPISSPALLHAASAMLTAAARDRDAAFWLAAASELELFCNDNQTKLQVTLLCAPRTKCRPGSFARAFSAFQQQDPAIACAGAIASDERTGPTGRVIAEAGSPGLAYSVLDETYWITRGGFFQVNRFLIGELVAAVTNGRTGTIAWDLFAGVGLFSRVLARNFAKVIAIEANAAACADNRAALGKIAGSHSAVALTTLDFLLGAVLQRERPELVVLDPPRAGVGVKACELLTQIGPATIVYVSCDPNTLARDLAELQKKYRIRALHLFDLFPQTFHLETVVILDHTR